MDERKRTIGELEQKRRADSEGRDLLLERLGEGLLGRLEGKKKGAGKLKAGEGAPGETAEEYRGLLREIAGFREGIGAIEEETRRLKELDEEISGKEGEHGAAVKELAGLYEQAGEMALGSPDYEGFSEAYRGQHDELLFKIESEEEKLEELEEGGGGFLRWLGSGARSVVIKGLLAKHRGSLTRLYRRAGERFAAPEHAGEAGEGEAGALLEHIAGVRERASSLTTDIAFLRGERRRAGEALNAGGNPARRVQGLEKDIARTEGAAREVCRRFGGYCLDPAWKGWYASLLTKEDSPVLGRIESLEASIKDTEGHIGKLKAAIAIDEEKAEIEKLKEGIEAERRRIAEAEESIREMGERIGDAENHITELTKRL
jgi:predicted  nucleic acid-binding Zn-ribbon protein